MSKTRGTKLFIVRFLPILVWSCFLAFWAFQSSRQITLRRAQILNADYIVTARIDSLEKKTVIVEEEWRGKNESELLKVENIDLTDAIAGRSYLIPLERISQTRYRIVLISPSQKRPAIYPSTEETQSQLREILETKN